MQFQKPRVRRSLFIRPPREPSAAQPKPDQPIQADLPALDEAKVRGRSTIDLDHQLDAVDGLLQSVCGNQFICVTAQDTIAEAILEDEKRDKHDPIRPTRDLFVKLGISENDQVRDDVLSATAVVITAYRLARKREKRPIRTDGVDRVLSNIEKAAEAIVQVHQDAVAKIRRKDPDAVRQALMLFNEALLTITVRTMVKGTVNRIRMMPPAPDDKRFGIDALRKAIRLRRGYASVAPRSPNTPELTSLSAVGRQVGVAEFGATARQIEHLGMVIESQQVGGRLIGIFADAAKLARETHRAHGIQIGPKPGLVLAWGCVELMVGFSPPNIRPSAADHGRLECLMRIIHNLAVSDSREGAVSIPDLRDANTAWKIGGRPALLFCDDVSGELEFQRAEKIRLAAWHATHDQPEAPDSDPDPL